MEREKRRRLTGVFIALAIVAVSFSPQFRSVYNLPPHLFIFAGEHQSFDLRFPISVYVTTDTAGVVKLNGSVLERESVKVSLASPLSLEPVTLGKATLEFRILGVIPLRRLEVDVLPAIYVVPGGHSIGVVLHAHGVIVVGYSPVESLDGRSYLPAKEANIAIGDVILAINGQPVESDTHVAEIIDKNGREGRPLDVTIKRGGRTLHTTLQPVLCPETKRYRIGLFIRDSAAGVGTLTFYEPKTRAYGALGHIITDSDTNQPIDVEQGKIVAATVSGIQYGKRGRPGEKIGVFIEEEKVLGNIKKNTAFGIYGVLLQPLKNDAVTEVIPVASMTQVKPGPAEILTVVDGQQIERFSIEIQKIMLQQVPESKGMVIKITDKRLLEKTGGIIQGMSGSPIIQDGKIVGAVTHVFVHDPTRGYGVFIDWMLMESGLLPGQNMHNARKLDLSFLAFFISRKFPDGAGSQGNFLPNFWKNSRKWRPFVENEVLWTKR